MIKKLNNKKTLLISSIITTCALSLQGCMPVAVVTAPAVVFGSNAVSTNQSTESQVHDFGIKFNILHIVQSDKTLKTKSNIETAVFNNIVLLLGQVPSQEVRNDLVKKISKIKYVTLVYDELTVGPIVSVGTYANDTWITTKVKSRFIGKVNPTHFKVITQKGVVYLMAVTTKKDGDIASEIASRTTGVKKVIEIYAYIKETPKDQDAKIVKHDKNGNLTRN
jgi:osmotically-inducible protein OsmY